MVAVVDSHAARLFVLAPGLLREVRGQSDDPKYFHKVRGTNAMNQGRYLGYTEQRRETFGKEAAERIEQMVDRTRADRVILAGEQGPASLVRRSLSPRIASLVHEEPLRLDFEAPREVIRAEVEPLIQEAAAEQEHALVERLVSGVQSGGLGVAGHNPTRAALESGQADTLVLSDDAPIPAEERSALLSLAARTDASIEIVEPNETLTRLGGVGALLRYRS